LAFLPVWNAETANRRDTNGENIAPPIQWISKNIAIESAKVISEEIGGDLQTGQKIESFGADPQTDKLNSQLDMWLK
jgi:hypothetical protein